MVPDNWIFVVANHMFCRFTTSLDKVKRAGPMNPNWQVYKISKILKKSFSMFFDYSDFNSKHETVFNL